MSDETSPGPWRWESECDLTEPVSEGRLLDATGAEICNFGGGRQWEESAGTGPREADARLIAAAPRMRELLREAMGWLGDPSAYAQDDGDDFDDRVRALLAEIDAPPTAAV